MKPRLKAIAFSDLHLHNFTAKENFRYQRLESAIKVMKVLGELAHKKQVPILFSGDLVHNPRSAGNEVLHYLLPVIREISKKGVKIYAIDGNHDQLQSNRLDSRSINYVSTIARTINGFYNLGDYTISKNPTDWVFGIPYMSNIEDFNARLKSFNYDEVHNCILLAHLDYPGAADTTNFVFPDNALDKTLLKKWGLVLLGHIHKPQVLEPNIVMLGSPTQQRTSDSGVEMGYWEIYEDLTYKMVPIDWAPKFRFYSKAPKNETDLWIKRPMAKIKGRKETKTTASYTDTLEERVKVAKNYCEAEKVKDPEKVQRLIKVISENS